MKLTVQPRILLVSHSGRFCSGGLLLYLCAKALTRQGIKLEIEFACEPPLENVLIGYAELGAHITRQPTGRYDLILANCQATAARIVELTRVLPGSPIVLWIHEAWLHRIPTVMEKAMETVAAVIFETPHQRDVLYQQFLTHRAIPVYIVPNTILVEELPVHLYAEKSRPRIVAVGALQPRKRQVDLLRAVCHLQADVECYIVGKCKEEDPDIMALVRRYPDRILFTVAPGPCSAASVINVPSIRIRSL